MNLQFQQNFWCSSSQVTILWGFLSMNHTIRLQHQSIYQSINQSINTNLQSVIKYVNTLPAHHVHYKTCIKQSWSFNLPTTYTLVYHSRCFITNNIVILALRRSSPKLQNVIWFSARTTFSWFSEQCVQKGWGTTDVWVSIRLVLIQTFQRHQIINMNHQTV